MDKLLLLLVIILAIVSSWSYGLFRTLDLKETKNCGLSTTYIKTGKIVLGLLTLFSLVVLLAVSVLIYKKSSTV
jgi:hypothetical protein